MIEELTQFERTGNPFPGLRPFETEEYNLFFGREGQSDELLARLGRTRFLAVVGTSGSGKSSLIRAGLKPALYGGLMAGTGSAWRIAVMRPGHDPLGNLARELAEDSVLGSTEVDDVVRASIIETTLRRSTLGLVDAVRQERLPAGENVLVVVDQFEELFRFRAMRGQQGTDDEASAFVKLLLEAARQRDLPVYVVLTMRSDFLGDCSQFQGLPEAINDGQYLIPRMTRDERRMAITGPALVGDGEISPPLVNRLLNDVGDNPDQLPILQHALMRTWNHWSAHRRDGEPVGLDDYLAVGTMSDALSKHADEAFDELADERSRHVAEVLFKALTERGADNREVRRPTRLREVCEITGASPAEVAAVVEVFRGEGRSFLMPPAGVALEPETVIDISHESLIRNWERLREWVKDEAESARIYRRLADAAAAHRAGEGGLLDDVTLGWVNRWRERYNPNRAWGLRYHPGYDEAMAYLEESRAAREAEAAERQRQRQAEFERERREREQAEAFAEQQRRAAQRLRRFTFALVLISVFALAAAGVSVYALTAARRSEASANEKSAQLVRARAQEKELNTQLQASLTASQEAEAAAKDAETAAKEDRQKALDAEGRAQDAAKLAASRLTEAVAAKQKAQDTANDLNRSLLALSTARTNDQLNRLAVAQFQRGNIEGAEKAFEGLVATYTGSDENLWSLAWAKSNLGDAHRRLGRLDDGIRELEEARAMQEKDIAEGKRFGEGDLEYLDTITWLAHAYSDKGQYEQAQPLYLRVLEHRRAAGRQTDIALSLEHLARNLNNLYEPAEAAKLYEEALALRRQNPNSPDLIVALKEVAKFYVEQEKTDAAIKLYEEAIARQEGYLELYDSNLADTFAGLAEVYEETPLKGRADAYNALARATRKTDPNRPGAWSDLGELIQAYVSVGRYREAAQLRALEQQNLARQQGAEAQGPVNNLVGLGNFYVKATRLAPEADRRQFYASASETYERALEISARKSYAGTEVDALDGLARLNLEQKNFAEAERYYKRALEMRERGQADQSQAAQLTLENLEGLALSASGLGKHAEAEAHLLRALKFYDGLSFIARAEMTVRSINAPLVRHALSARLAEVYRAQGRLKEADEQYRPLAGLLKTDVGPDSFTSEVNAERYLRIIESAARFYAERGDAAAAESFYLLVWPPEIRPVVQTIPQWPEASSKSLLELAPASSLDAVVRVLESYAALLEKQGRDRDAGLISHGIEHARQRLLNEMPGRQP